MNLTLLFAYWLHLVYYVSVYLCSSYSPRDHNENKVNADLYYVIPATSYF